MENVETETRPGEVSLDYERRHNRSHLWMAYCKKPCGWATEGPRPQVNAAVSDHLDRYHGGEGNISEPTRYIKPYTWKEA